MDILYKYMVQGIIDSGIREDGGPDCYAEIPKLYHVGVGCLATLGHLVIMWVWGGSLTTGYQGRNTEVKPSLVEKVVAVLGIISLALTFYFKFITGKGLFIFNPCHTALLIQIVLLLCPTSKVTRQLHTCWTTWLFGAMLALLIPHLYGITQFQVYLYYFEHLLIVPIGPLVLYRRYKFVRPGFRNQMAGFATMVIYQLAVLMNLGLLTQVNLNFALCHSPADPFYPHIGYHYFTAGVFVLNVLSYLARWIKYLMILPIKTVLDYRNDDADNGDEGKIDGKDVGKHSGEGAGEGGKKSM